MEPFLRYLYTYVSISGPHLGYLYSSNSLFNSGLWLLKKFKGTQCIHQLTFTDDPDLQNTFFYKLCKVMDKFFCWSCLVKIYIYIYNYLTFPHKIENERDCNIIFNLFSYHNNEIQALCIFCTLGRRYKLAI